MTNYVTLNTAEITGVGSITSGSIIPTGSKGEKGDRGERGPQGLPGNARINDSVVSGVETWSSKKIVDYVQLNDIIWSSKTIEGDGKVDHTKKGYIKGLEIEGRTLENVAPNPVNFEDWTTSRGKVTKSNKTIKLEIDSTSAVNSLTEVTANWKEATYTIQFEYKLTGDNAKELIVSRFSTTNGVITKKQPTDEFTRVKERFYADSPTVLNALCIYLIPKNTDIKNGGILEVKNIVILEGDYTQKDAPEFIEGVQGVGLQAENGYKITIKTHNEGNTEESIQEVILQQQLNTGDKLVFENGEYVIKTSTGQTVKTNVNNEMLPATFEGGTYVEQDAGVKGTLKGKYPINSKAAITSLEQQNKELKERLEDQENKINTLYSFYVSTLEEV